MLKNTWLMHLISYVFPEKIPNLSKLNSNTLCMYCIKSLYIYIISCIWSSIDRATIGCITESLSRARMHLPVWQFAMKCNLSFRWAKCVVHARKKRYPQGNNRGQSSGREICSNSYLHRRRGIHRESTQFFPAFIKTPLPWLILLYNILSPQYYESRF